MEVNLISPKIRKELQGILDFCFIGNAIADNVVYQLDVKKVMPRTTDIVHLHFSHILPLLADVISDYTADRNEYLHRGAIPAQDKEYENVVDMFDDLLTYMLDLEKLVGYSINVCIEENDKVTMKVLDRFLRNLVPYTKMMIDFNDYIRMNGSSPKDLMDMDFAINHFIGVPTDIETNLGVDAFTDDDD